MKKNFSRILFCTALCSVFALAQSSVTPTLVLRSQSRDKVRQMVNVVGGIDRTNHTHRYGMDSSWGMGSIMVEYTQSFRPGHIAHCLFGDDLTTGTTACSPCPTTCSTSCATSCNNSCSNPCSNPCSSSSSCPSSNSCGESIFIQGSRVTNRNSTAWLADYFYLPSDFDGSISFKPRIRNVIVDFDAYWGMDQWVTGMYFRLYGPVVNTRWDLNFCECISNAGTNSYPEGYFAPNCLSNAALLKSFASYAAGNTIQDCNGIVFQPLKFAKIVPCERTKTGFAELRGEFGWDFIQNYDYHLGINIQAAAPTGNKRHAEFAFAPVVGNGHHWELGGGLTTHYTFIRSEDELKSFSFHFDANLTHLFRGEEERTFDLKGKPNSRYMLASKFTQNISNFLKGSPNANQLTGTPAVFQFANEYAPVANLTTLKVKTSIGIQADVVAMFNVSIHGFSWDLGYNLWARSCERIHCPSLCATCDCTDSLCDPSQANKWGLKGDARMFGFAANQQGDPTKLQTDTVVALSATESKADIHSGTNIPGHLDTISNDPYERNFSVDNAQYAYGSANSGTPLSNLNFAPFLPNSNDGIADQIKTSMPSILLTCKDIDLCERTKGISHKIFTNIGYTFDTQSCKPFVGFGAFGEWGKTTGGSSGSCNTSCNTACTTTTCTTACSSDCSSSDNSCFNCALSQWGVWLKLGLVFDGCCM